MGQVNYELFFILWLVPRCHAAHLRALLSTPSEAFRRRLALAFDLFHHDQVLHRTTQHNVTRLLRLLLPLPFLLLRLAIQFLIRNSFNPGKLLAFGLDAHGVVDVIQALRLENLGVDVASDKALGLLTSHRKDITLRVIYKNFILLIFLGTSYTVNSQLVQLMLVVIYERLSI